MDRQVSCKFEPLSKSFTNSHFQAASRNEGESVTLDMVSFKTVSKLSKFTWISSGNQSQVGEGVEDMKREQVRVPFGFLLFQEELVAHAIKHTIPTFHHMCPPGSAESADRPDWGKSGADHGDYAKQKTRRRPQLKTLKTVSLFWYNNKIMAMAIKGNQHLQSFNL